MMKPVEFDGVNAVFGKGQKEYEPLPGMSTKDGIVITCWKMPVWERFLFLFTGKVWLVQSTFKQPLQPIRLDRVCPIQYETVETTD